MIFRRNLMVSTASATSQGMHSRRLAFVLLCLARFMVVLDASIVNVALPSMQHDFGLSMATLQWVVSIYSLTFGSFLLLSGRAGDLFGRRRLFMGGLVLFSLASLAGGWRHRASGLSSFVASREWGRPWSPRPRSHSSPRCMRKDQPVTARLGSPAQSAPSALQWVRCW